ncbi:hypothetical protein PUN28_020181 [Cardiocondyla obscurior]|uniref:Uncharacterized protein n=1 Tax=Cardiocondyla obscurior TaxID=286306 RepID=A0AAW2E9S6_9HYME
MVQLQRKIKFIKSCNCEHCVMESTLRIFKERNQYVYIIVLKRDKRNTTTTKICNNKNTTVAISNFHSRLIITIYCCILRLFGRKKKNKKLNITIS